MQRPSTPILEPSTSPRIRVGLDVIIQSINTMRELVPVELARGVLSAFSGVLTLAQKYLVNSDDIGDVGQRCHHVSLVIWKGVQNDEPISETLKETLLELQRFIEGVQANIEKQRKRNVLSKVLSVSVDSETIAGWKEELDYFIFVLNAELGISANVKLDQLIRMFQTQQISRTTYDLAFLIQESITNRLISETSSFPLPLAKPPIFFGRETAVQDTVAAVLRSEHVALIGPGGIGKSSISKAVLHEHEVVSRFGARRYFATYDGISSSMMTYITFLTYLAEALNIPTSSRLSTRAILSHIGSENTLIVLDNAETFLDAKHDDTGHIAEAITEIGAQPSITLLLTTRSRSLPKGLRWSPIVVSGLGLDASRLAFSAVYRHDVDIRLDSIFESLECHALSISLLAHTAAQNDWSVEQLEVMWRQKKTQLLHTGNGRHESLALTVELSIQSPILASSTDTVMLLLRAVAFLPQGIHSGDVAPMLAKNGDVDAIAGLLCRCSLIHRVADHLTMLAPIRMYITDQYNGRLEYHDPLLVSIRQYYSTMLDADSEAWVRHEGMNMEHLLLFDLTSEYFKLPESWIIRNTAFRIVSVYLDAMKALRRRGCNLLSALVTVSEDRPMLKVGKLEWGHRPNKSLLLAKAECLRTVCDLEYNSQQWDSAISSLSVAEEFCRKHLHVCAEVFVRCLMLKSLILYAWADLSPAEEVLREGLAMARSLNLDMDVALLEASLCNVMLARGNFTEATSLQSSCQTYYELYDENRDTASGKLVLNRDAALIQSFKDRADIFTCQGNWAGACLQIENALQLALKNDNMSEHRKRLWILKASCDAFAGDITGAMKTLETVIALETDLLNQSEFISLQDALFGLAYYQAWMGNFEESRDILARVKEFEGHHLSGYSLTAAYIEIQAGNGVIAMDILRMCLRDTSASKNMLWTAILHRALGEAALISGDIDEAKTQFAEVMSICDRTGLSPTCLYVGYKHWDTLPNTRFTGWPRFLCQEL